MISFTRAGRATRGVTTFELGLAVAALALLGLAGMYVIQPVFGKDTSAVAQRDAAVIQKAAVHWRQDNPVGCPTLSVLLDERQLVRGASVDDPWGGKYRVRCEERKTSVTSPGRDRRAGTSDDVHYPQS
jgi:hypothetical protein